MRLELGADPTLYKWPQVQMKALYTYLGLVKLWTPLGNTLNTPMIKQDVRNEQINALQK